MGVLSEKFKFFLDEQNWRVDMLFRLKGYRYRVFLDGELVFDHQLRQTSEDMQETTQLTFTHRGKDYALETALVSLWKYGLHVYLGGRQIYRHQDQDFVDLPKLKRFARRTDKFKGDDDRPFGNTFWKADWLAGRWVSSAVLERALPEMRD